MKHQRLQDVLQQALTAAFDARAGPCLNGDEYIVFRHRLQSHQQSNRMNVQATSMHSAHHHLLHTEFTGSAIDPGFVSSMLTMLMLYGASRSSASEIRLVT